MPKGDLAPTPTDSPICLGLGISSNVVSQVEKPATRRRGRQKRDLIPETEIDLTDGYVPPSKSKRAADTLQTDIWETLEIESQEDTTAMTGSGRKKGKSAPKKTAPGKKTKRLTYKQALKVIQAPNASSSSPPKKITPKRNSRNSNKSQTPPRTEPAGRSRYSGIDLTGEVELTEIHSKAPLFQKLPETEVQQPEQMNEESSDELDLDLDAIRFKVRTSRGIEVFPMRLHQKIQTVFTELSKREKVPVSNIFLFDGDKRIDPDETPYDIGSKVSTIYKLTVMNLEDDLKSSAQKKNQIELKFQWDKDRYKYKSKSNRMENSANLKVSKFDSFKVIIEILCENIKLQTHQIQLIFDGDEIELNATPQDEGFEGGETLDCKIKI